MQNLRLKSLRIMIGVRMKISNIQRGLREGYRSGLELNIGEQLNAAKVMWRYEPERITYTPKKQTYTPDFLLQGQGIKLYVETKGRFLAKDRTKHLLLQSQYPNMDLRFVFTNPNQKLYKGSKTTYGEWCNKHGFIFSKGRIPESWIRECMYTA